MTQLKIHGGNCFLQAVDENIIRCVYTKKDEIDACSPIGIRAESSAALKNVSAAGSTVFETERLRLEIDERSGRVTWYRKQAGLKLLLREGGMELTETPLQEWTTGGEEPVIRRVHTVDGDRNFVENLRPETKRMAYRAKLFFDFQDGEQIHGLGQGEEGIYNYRGQVQYLYQHNMRIPMPWILSDRGYAILVDCGCLMTWNDDARGSYLFLDNVEQLDYYFIAGENADELIRSFRRLTGRAAMLPKWAFGYVQSKERYESQQELVETAAQYRQRGIGLDCIVQDWKTWVGDLWGEKHVDPARFPDLAAMRRALHDMHVHSMVSVWPNMNYDTQDCQEMQEAGHLLHDLATYDAFDEEARALYWKQASEGLYRDGFDSWWCDSTEPFSGPDWGGETRREPWERFGLVGGEHKKFLGAQRANLYALYHARGIFENQKKEDPAHRVLNLTRSGYAGIWRFGAVLWSGDTSATWKTLKNQVTEGLNMAISGVPYWTLDAGAFFTVKDNWRARGCGCNTDPTPKWFWQGDFEEGTADPGYRELYVRWLQLAAFLPMMRSHGTDTPREIWQFGEKGTPYYDAIADCIALRYRLMPYIYSLAGAAALDDDTIMRPLLFDFAADPKAAAMDSQFMFGRSLLVCPVTEPMDFGPGKQVLDRPHTWTCYLPAGCAWYDFRTSADGHTPLTCTLYEGGQEVEADAPLGQIPLFVRAGSIIPMEHALLYAQEQADTPLEIHIWPGADGDFTLYEDAGDGYAYESGEFARIQMHWDDAAQKLRISACPAQIPGGLCGRRVTVFVLGREAAGLIYTGDAVEITCG